jgi:uncharacterized protein Yka (UPF0111/DUF47 family)
MNIADFISNVGFPVALCFYLMYNQSIMQKQHKEEMETLSANFSKAIDNNTKAIDRLERTVEKWQKKE